MLYQMVYVSSATRLFAPDELAQLLAQARRNNARDGISGMLLYHGGTFMQAFEGTAEATQALRSRIGADPRHRGILELYHSPIDERCFGEWTMGFYGGGEILEAEPAFHALTPRTAPPALLSAAGGRARKLLLSFQQKMAQ